MTVMMMLIQLPCGRIHIMRSMMIRGSIVAAAAVTDAVVADTAHDRFLPTPSLSLSLSLSSFTTSFCQLKKEKAMILLLKQLQEVILLLIII